MARRGDVDDYGYDDPPYYPPERERQRQRPAPVRGRDLLDLRIQERDRAPDFVQPDYRDDSQPLVLRERRVETFTRPVQRRSPPRERSPSFERERTTTRTLERERDRDRDWTPSPPAVERTRTKVVETERDGRRSPPIYERSRTKTVERERDRSPTPPEYERTRTRVVERERERSPSPPVVERTRTRVVERERERDRSPVSDRARLRVVERERDRDISPARSDIRSEVRVRTRDVERERRRSPSPSGFERVRTTDRVVERERDRSPSPRGVERVRTRERVVERERDRSPSPLRERERVRTRVVERDRERARSPSIDSSISSHHRYNDHGYDYAPTPPPPRPRVAEKETEIDIRTRRGETEIDVRKTTRRGDRERPRDRDFYDDGDVYEREVEIERRRGPPGRRRSVSGGRDRDVIGSNESESDYYARRVEERAYIGEAYNGATKRWEIVDVPPGTERVKMDGIGGASQEITWQRYNGVRRSTFQAERSSESSFDREYEREEVTDRRVGRPAPAPPRTRLDDKWTEITKDLVVREAIKELGYDFEETEFFFYVMRYLSYEDVQELVLLSEDIKRDRRRRIKQMARERDRLKEPTMLALPAPPERRRASSTYDEERIVDREIVYDVPRRAR